MVGRRLDVAEHAQLVVGRRGEAGGPVGRDPHGGEPREPELRHLRLRGLEVGRPHCVLGDPERHRRAGGVRPSGRTGGGDREQADDGEEAPSHGQ